MQYRFEPDELIEAAMKQTGLDRFQRRLPHCSNDIPTAMTSSRMPDI